jgi:hypothetical protein
MSTLDIHERTLRKATTLSGFAMPDAIHPLEVITVLNREGVSFVLVGAYGLSGWVVKPRATEDVDVVVAAKHHKKAVKALLAEFSHLESCDLPVVTRLRDRETQEVAVDIIKPNQELYRAAFKHTHKVQMQGQTYRVPSLEMALAMKFAPMISLYRDDADKHMDAHDFMKMVRAHEEIDLQTLKELGNLVYPGGGAEILELVGKVRTGEQLQL